jgi:hypothetical protein
VPSTARINREQRDGIYELVRNHLAGIGDVAIALEDNEDIATAERLAIEFGEDFRLLDDIGWRPRLRRSPGSCARRSPAFSSPRVRRIEPRSPTS